MSDSFLDVLLIFLGNNRLFREDSIKIQQIYAA